MRDILLLPTAYMPSIVYFYFLLNTENAIIEQHETFPKQTIRNRTTILTDKGPFLLSIPVNKPNGNHSKTNEITICYKQNWIQKHWRAMETAYNSSPFFLYYKDELLAILNKRYQLLIDLNKDLLDFFLRKLKIQTTIEYSERFNSDILSVDALLGGTENLLNFPAYHQVFSERYNFVPNMSILDLLFNKGPESLAYLKMVKENSKT